VSAGLIAAAPILMPAGYSWVANSISESGAQGVTGAWATRVGFLLLGLGVILLSTSKDMSWRSPARVLLGIYGFLMLCVAAFSTSWFDTTIPSNATESMLHSVAASVTGFFYGIGIFWVALTERPMSTRWRIFSLVVVASSIALPIGAGVFSDLGGLLQRLMFLLAFIWFIGEARRARQGATA
jgi:hypothetical protein